jgi:site-specific recombinase XerD
MDTVYIFFDHDKVRIRFTDYDKGLFNRLYNTKMGQWDNDKRQYSILRTQYNADVIKSLLEGKAYIEVGKEANAPVLINGFLNEWEHEPKELTPENELPGQFSEHWREKLEIEMRVLDFSKHTLDAYINSNKALCKWLQKKPEQVTTDDVKRYLAYHQKYKNQAASTLNSALSAFKFFYFNVMKRDIVKDQRRPRQDKRLPVVFSKAQINTIFEGETNKKHSLLLKIAYGSGLRVSEVVNLRKEDIDLSQKILTVKGGKGRKARTTILSHKVIDELEQYFKQYSITGWVFTGADPNDHLHIRSAQYIFKDALKKSGIKKTASIHSLRHSFATHLLESGYDIVRIRDLLGHSSVRTTERYLQVAITKTLNVISPLDTLDQKMDVAVDFRPENRDFYDKNDRRK